jgi:hypothetical protein
MPDQLNFDDPVLDIDEFDVAAVCYQGGADLV